MSVLPADLRQHQPRNTAGVSCLAWKPVTGTGAVIGFAELHFVPFRLRLSGCAAFVSGGRRWVALPFRQMLGRDGQPLVAFDDAETQQRFSDAAVAAIEVYAPGAFEGARG